MATLIRLCLVSLLFSLGLLGQPKLYSASTLKTSVTSAKLTLQSPASGSSRSIIVKAMVSCSTACTVTFERNGTAATTTAGTAVVLGPWRTATTLVYVDSNVGSGTTVWPTALLPAGTTQVFELEGIELDKDNTAKNFTIGVTGSSGNFNIGIMWKEN